MKKISAREFQKRFGRLTKALADGQIVQVTNHDRPVGIFIKGPPRRVKTPDFLANLRTSECDEQTGEQIIAEFNASLS